MGLVCCTWLTTHDNEPVMNSCIIVTWWSGSGGIQAWSLATNWFPSLLWHCWFGHLACKNRPRNDLLCVEWDVVKPLHYYCTTAINPLVLWLMGYLCVWAQLPSLQSSTEEEEEEKVMLFWNEGKKQKSIQDLVLDEQSEDLEILSYYR